MYGLSVWRWQGTHYIVFVFVVLVVLSVGAAWLLSVGVAGYKLHCFCICCASCFVSWSCMTSQYGGGRVHTILFLYLLC